MNTVMIPKDPAVKLLQEIKGNLDDMGKAGLKGELKSDAATFVCARLSGKIEQYLESIDKE